MATKGIYFYKLISPYSQDVTKNCKLSINEIDSNFFSLEEYDIKSAEFIREEKVLVLTRVNGEKLIVDLSNATYDLNVSKECGESGVTLNISYDGNDGEKSLTINNIVTADNVEEFIKRTEKVITDSTLKGIGNISSPLGIKETEKTGMYRPADAYFDFTTGGTLPPIAKYGTTYLTKEYVSEYGYLYNGAAVNKIKESLVNSNGWRIPTKADWDVLLNSIEPCEYRNHNSAKCHIELGKYAGKLLKSECGWLGQSECDCAITKPITGCSSPSFDDYASGDTTSGDEPSEEPFSPSGVDKYGFTILPSGMGSLDAYGRPTTNYFKEKSIFWTDSHVYDDPTQDSYVKVFDWDKGGVSQAAECPEVYYSIRLVKDFDGSNYQEVEYINGVAFKTILNAETSQIWLASNYNSVEGLVKYEEGGEEPDYIEVNNGEILEKRKEIFLNVWNGHYWEKKNLGEGDTVVIQNPCFNEETDEIEVSWVDSEGVTHTETVEIPVALQYNKEYRVYTDVENCDKILVNTDDLVIERILKVVLPLLFKEIEERKEADEEIRQALSAETEARISADTELSEALSAETEARETADEEIWDAISAITSGQEEIWEALSAETEARISADTELQEAIDAEEARAISAETELQEAIDSEAARAISAETELQEAIDAEEARAISAETELQEAIDAEEARAKEKEDEIDGQLIDATKDYVVKVIDGVELIMKNGNTIKIGFDGDFGMV